jgi:hypothetical protein
MPNTPPAIDVDDLLVSRACLAPNVVYREFPSETIMLNLVTGTYYGLNPVRGRMLVLLERVACVGAAIAPLAQEFDKPPEVIEGDLQELCRALHERGLIELVPCD